MAEERPGLDFIAKYLPEAVGYFQGRRAIKDEINRLREQGPLRQDRFQMDPSLQQAFREANTRGDIDQQENIDRQVQEAIRRNPRNIAKAIEAGQSASSKTRAADNLRRLEGLKSAGTLADRLNQLNSTIDLGNEMRERQQEDRIALAESQKRRLNAMGIKSLSSALGEGMDAFGKADKEVLLGPEGREERGLARSLARSGGRTSDLLDILGQGTTSSERPEVSLDGITIDPNVEPARNIPGQGGINIVTAPERVELLPVDLTRQNAPGPRQDQSIFEGIDDEIAAEGRAVPGTLVGDNLRQMDGRTMRAYQGVPSLPEPESNFDKVAQAMALRDLARRGYTDDFIFQDLFRDAVGPANREGGAVVTPDGYDHDGVDINMTDAENGKFLGSVESAEMIVNAEDTSEGLRLAKKNPNNPLSKWYLSLTKRFQKEAKEREIQNKR